MITRVSVVRRDLAGGGAHQPVTYCGSSRSAWQPGRGEGGRPPSVHPCDLRRGRCAGVGHVKGSGSEGGRDQGQRLLSIENDDPGAERMSQFLRGAGIGYGQVVPWNACPWCINSDPTAGRLSAGVEPLRGRDEPDAPTACGDPPRNRGGQGLEALLARASRPGRTPGHRRAGGLPRQPAGALGPRPGRARTA